MEDIVKNLKLRRKEVLTKGIEHKLLNGRVRAISNAELPPTEIRKGATTVANSLAKRTVVEDVYKLLSDYGYELSFDSQAEISAMNQYILEKAAIGQSPAKIVSQILETNTTSNFSTTGTPGQGPGTTGEHTGFVSGRQSSGPYNDEYTTPGPNQRKPTDKPTDVSDYGKVPNAEFNPTSPGQGYQVTIGAERYGDISSSSGSGSARQSNQTQTSPTRYSGLGLRGGQQPQLPPEGRGLSGLQGPGGSTVTSITGQDGRVAVKHHIHSSYQPNSNPAQVTKSFQEKLEASNPRNEELTKSIELDGSTRWAVGDLEEGLRAREYDLRKRAEETGEDLQNLRARDPLRNEFVKRINARKLFTK